MKVEEWKEGRRRRRFDRILPGRSRMRWKLKVEGGKVERKGNGDFARKVESEVGSGKLKSGKRGEEGGGLIGFCPEGRE